MKAEFKRDLKNNYLVLEGQEEAVGSDYCIPMVEQNKIPGLLPFHRSRTDGKLYLNYEITGKQTVESRYERRRIGYGEILQLLTGISGHLDVMQRYLLSPEQLLFDPQYMFTDPDGRNIWFCYVPQKEAETSVAQLAEFLLKRLDHQDPAAVELGYRFYARTQEENLSLSRMLQELLTDCKMGQKTPLPGEGSVEQVWKPDQMPDRSRIGVQPEPGMGRTRMEYEPRQVQKDQRVPSVGEQIGRENRTMRVNAHVDTEQSAGKEAGRKPEKNEEQPFVVHRERKTDSAKAKVQSGKKELRIFQIIHPAVLLTMLFLFAVLEVVFYYGYLNVTEAGGCFFLVLSGELLANSLWKRKKEEKRMELSGQWQNEEEDEDEQEAYEQLRQELYQSPVLEQMRMTEDRVEETRCLTDLQEPCGMRLVYIQPEGNAGETAQTFPDIYIGVDAVTIGKLQGQCEVLLNSATVSRIHARLEYRNGNGYVRDLNSRNGTFLNGERLEPQELRLFSEGARIAFADVQYRATTAHTPF